MSSLQIGNVVYAPSLPFVEPMASVEIADNFQPEPEIVVRKRARKRAFEKVDQWTKEKYRNCIFEVGRQRETFGAWAVTAHFNGKFAALDKTQLKALGGIYTEFLEQRIIEEAGTGKRPNGNIGPTYRLRRDK
jgi:hypothetical protein